jgi:hypothetical protein
MIEYSTEQFCNTDMTNIVLWASFQSLLKLQKLPEKIEPYRDYIQKQYLSEISGCGKEATVPIVLLNYKFGKVPVENEEDTREQYKLAIIPIKYHKLAAVNPEVFSYGLAKLEENHKYLKSKCSINPTDPIAFCLPLILPNVSFNSMQSYITTPLLTTKRLYKIFVR